MESKSTLDFTTRPIAVFGDVILDQYIIGEANRISPEAPVPIIDYKHTTSNLGGAGNVAKNVSALGGTPILYGVVGDDRAADTVRHILDISDIEHNLIIDSSRPTITKTRVMSGRHQICRYDKENQSNVDYDALGEYIWEGLSPKDVAGVSIADYNKGTMQRSDIGYIISVCQVDGIPSVADPKKNFWLYSGIQVIKPNKKELNWAAGNKGIQVIGVQRKCAAIQDLLPCDAIIVTLGDSGMYQYERCRTKNNISTYATCWIPAHKHEVFDVCGAGDTVNAALTLALASGYTISQAAQIANLAGGMSVEKMGCATVSFDKLQTRVKGEG